MSSYYEYQINTGLNPYYGSEVYGQSTTTPIGTPCPWCSSPLYSVYHVGFCPRVKAIEYYENGTMKRVEFREENDQLNCS